MTNLPGLIKLAVGSCEDGQTTIEYVLVIVLVILVMVLTLQTGLLENAISATISKISSAIG